MAMVAIKNGQSERVVQMRQAVETEVPLTITREQTGTQTRCDRAPAHCRRHPLDRLKIGLGLGVGLSRGIDPMENWIWGLLLIALTMVIHGTGVLWIALADARIRVRIERQNRLRWRHTLEFIVVLIGLVGLLLAALHGIEAALWAAAYWWLGALNSPADAILYSIDSISTRGASGLILEHQWRLMGALEAVDGMLLFGISTAFVFTVMQAYWPLLTRRP